MAISLPLFGTTRSIPVTRERNWGAQVTSILADLVRFANAAGFVVGDNGLLRIDGEALELADGATLTPTKSFHSVIGDGEPATLDGTTAIANGVVNRQVLILVGASSTNTVTIPSGANTALNGSVTLGLAEAIFLMWAESSSFWHEIARSH